MLPPALKWPKNIEIFQRFRLANSLARTTNPQALADVLQSKHTHITYYIV